jgi:hypothetical protein
MKAFIILFSFALLLVFSGCQNMENTTPVSPQDEITMSKVPVPFKVKWDAVSTLTPTGPYTGTGLIEGGGIGTHVGKFTSLTTNEYQLTSATSGILSNGVHTLTAANGDLMYATFTGSWIVNSEGIYEYTSTMVFTGGTGRFVNLEGTLNFIAYGENIDLLHKTMFADIEGYITY